MSTFLSLLLPGLAVVIPAALWMVVEPESPTLAAMSEGYPAAALVLALFLAWRFQRSRAFAATLALMVAYALLGAWPAENPEAAVEAGKLMLPLVLGGLAVSVDRRVGAPQGLAQIAIVLWAGGAAVMMLALAPAEAARWLGVRLVDPAYTEWARMEQPALLAAIVGVIVVLTMAVLRRGLTEAGIGWALLASLASLTFPAEEVGRGSFMLAAGVVLVLSVVESSYGMAFRDDLTSLPGRRALRAMLDVLRPPYSIAVIDVDNFKQVNDRYGHDVGDQVLQMVAAKLGRVGGGGRAFRSGGEEFTLVFPGLTRGEAFPHVEAVRAAVEEESFTLRHRFRAVGTKGASKRGQGSEPSREIRITVSAGLASPVEGEIVGEVVEAADRAMYRAKSTGRNRVIPG